MQILPHARVPSTVYAVYGVALFTPTCPYARRSKPLAVLGVSVIMALNACMHACMCNVCLPEMCNKEVIINNITLVCFVYCTVAGGMMVI